MTAPLAFPQVPTAQRPWQQQGGGYEQATQQAQPQGGGPAAPLQQDVSPLAQVAPRLPWEQGQPRQQQVQPQTPPQPQFPQNPQGQFQIPQGVDLNARLYGGNIPQELQGRTVGEMVGMLNGLRQVHLTSLAQPGPVSPQQPQAQSPILNQTAAQQAAAGQVPGAQPFNWRNPEESFAKIMDDRLNQFQARITPMLAPVVQQGQINQASAAMAQVAAEIPNFAQLQPAIFQRLQGIDPASLANPETWRIAARVAIGDLALRGQQPQFQAPQQPAQQGAQQAFQPQQVQMGQNPAPNYSSWFSEQPMQGGPGGVAPIPLTQQERNAADAMGQSYADYAAWKTGVSAPSAQPFLGRR